MPGMWLGHGSRRPLVIALALVASGLAACGAGHAPGTTSRASAGDGPDGISNLPAPKGVHVVVNHHPVHLTLELDGADVGVSETDPGVWVVDGQIIQVAVVPQQAIYGAARTGVSNAQLLLDHLAWESDYASSELGLPVRARPRECRTARGEACLISGYDSESRRRHLLVTTVVNDQVVALGSIVAATRDSAAAEARLLAVLETITPRDGWIDPAREAERLHIEPIAP
jgi:hypothetical protein